MRVIVFFFAYLALAGPLAAQQTLFTGSPITDTIPVDLLKGINQRLQEKKKMIEADKMYKASFVSDIYEKQSESLIKFYNDDYFICEGPLYNYLNSILDRILSKNPQLPKEVRILPFRSATPNALTFWDGTIGFTLGLLAKMENEDQIAFIICHEMAHYYKQHHLKRVKEFTRTNFDTNLEKEIRSIKHGQYETYSKHKELMRKLGFSFSKHSREDEFDADSVGFVYLLNASYSPMGSYRTMEILDSVEVKEYKLNVDFRKHFTFAEYAFKDSWLKYEKSSFMHKKPEDEFGNSDTLKSHPDCMKRLARLKEITVTHFTDKKDVQVREAATVNSVAKRCGFELVDSEHHFRNYGKSLYYAFDLLERYPQSKYITAMIGINLYGIYNSQKNHVMSKSVSLPNTNYPETYNRFLAFFHGLRLSEIGMLSYQYVVNRPKDYFEYDDYLYAFWLVSHFQSSVISPNLIKDSYLEKFPQGKYKIKINQKL
jgi:Zn-dependent protease with chaperone function